MSHSDQSFPQYFYNCSVQVHNWLELFSMTQTWTLFKLSDQVIAGIIAPRLLSQRNYNFDLTQVCLSLLLMYSLFSRLRWLKTVSSTFQDVDFDGSLLPLFISWCYNRGIKTLPNHWWTRWLYFREVIGYHSNTMTYFDSAVEGKFPSFPILKRIFQFDNFLSKIQIICSFGVIRKESK